MLQNLLIFYRDVKKLRLPKKFKLIQLILISLIAGKFTLLAEKPNQTTSSHAGSINNTKSNSRSLNAEDPSLIGFWRLLGGTQDESGKKNHGTNHGVVLTSGKPALFNGTNAYIEVPHSKSLTLGTGNFSVAVSIHTEKNLDDVIGDILSKFDTSSRTGFQLSIKNHAGVTSSQSNDRHPHFGIDDGKIDPKWIDHGQLGNAVLIYSMAVYNGQLYAGTCVPGKDAAGHVYRFDGGDKWIDCGTLDKCNTVSSLAVLNGRLYAGTARYRLRGSALKRTENPNTGGNVFRLEEDGSWTHCGNLPGVEAINGMVAYKGKLYASSMYKPAAFYRYDGDKQWTSCPVPNDGKRVESLAIYNGHLYATSYDGGDQFGGAVYRYDGKTWSHLGRVSEKSRQTYGFAVYKGHLHVSEWPHANVYRYEGGKKWTSIGRLGNEKESMPLNIYNGKMYSGSLPLGEVYRYDGEKKWTNMGRLDLTPDVLYRRVWSMAVFKGRLFAGTLPTGHVHSIEAGKNATCDTALKPGWRHIVASRDKNRLNLFVDGKLVATSSAYKPDDYDLTNTNPLKIGFGSHDYFNGQMKNLRLYNRALSEKEVKALWKSEM